MQESSKNYVDKLIVCGHFNPDVGNKIYEEFFSGKYNHDKLFSVTDAINLGINVEKVDHMPKFIENITCYI